MKTKNYQTYPVYLREGNYRVKIAAGPYVIWQSLKVESKSVTLNINSLKNRKTDVTIKTTSYDSANGKNLTDDTKFFLSYRGKWVLMEEVPAEDIKSGSIIKVLARCDGYEDAVYSLLLDWYQDELIISAAMQKSEEVKK